MNERTTNAIEVRNLVKGYKGVPVLHDVSFTVGRGTVWAAFAWATGILVVSYTLALRIYRRSAPVAAA
jgi:hypothetical protein